MDTNEHEIVFGAIAEYFGRRQFGGEFMQAASAACAAWRSRFIFLYAL